MTRYKKVETSNGRTMFFINGDMVSIKALPEGLALRLESGVELDIDDGKSKTVEQTEPTIVKSKQLKPIDTSVCVICGEPATTQRFLQLVNVGMCKEHREKLSAGKVVQAMHEKHLL